MALRVKHICFCRKRNAAMRILCYKRRRQFLGFIDPSNIGKITNLGCAQRRIGRGCFQLSSNNATASFNWNRSLAI